MKLFECADGTLINPEQVTHCRSYQEGGKHIAQFSFGGFGREILFDSKSYAEGEIKSFRQHCKEI